ncbi:MAG TPA: hypothetical protein VME24_06585 [Alphaproteobacteria bacterium]|nr:hypothetical protein [Alphaproteobacteria bacterium]
MADQDQKLCDNCHERPATNHICYGGQDGQSRSLCQICLMQDSEVGSLMQHFTEAVRAGHCKYCGAPAETGSGRFSSAVGEHFDLLCKACSEDFVEFARRPENAMPDIPADYEAALRDEELMKQRLQQFKDREQRQEEFMRQRVSERKSRGDA